MIDDGTAHPLWSRGIVAAVAALLVVYDVIAIANGWSTISAQVRVINEDSGWLVAWAIAGLWLHWFFFPLMKAIFHP